MKLKTRGKIARYYKFLFLKYFRNKSDISIDLKEKKSLDFIYLSIANKKSFPLLKASLTSLYFSSSELPKEVIIVSDGSFDIVEGEQFFSFWPGKLSIKDWSESANYFKANGEENLSIWAGKQIWGKKLAAILYYAMQDAVLFSDTDILWFKQIVTKEFLDKKHVLKTSIDNSVNYDQNLIAHLNLETLNSKTPINCGVVFIKGKFFDRSKLLRRAIDFEAKQPGPFSEQTIFAILVSEFGSLFTLDEIESKIGDSYWPIIPNYKKAYPSAYARHYLWILKWMFWRDFYFIFVKKVKQFS